MPENVYINKDERRIVVFHELPEEAAFGDIRIFYDLKGNLTVEGGRDIIIEPVAANRVVIRFKG